jgi:hypothetical protein
LSETYQKAKELEKGILQKKSMLTITSAYPKHHTPFTPTTTPQTFQLEKQPQTPQTTTTQQAKIIPPKSIEPRKCWGCQEPWTPIHKFSCKLRRAVNSMALNAEYWLVVEQVMEEENHSLLQSELLDTDKQETPQLLLLSSHAAHVTSSAATFCLWVGKEDWDWLTMVV